MAEMHARGDAATLCDDGAVKLPNAADAVVAREKIVLYLLVPEHPENSGKAAFFFRFGFRRDRWEEMARAFQAHTRHDVAGIINAPFGVVYTIEGPLNTPDRRMPAVRSVWQIDTGATVPRFITAYPL